MTEPIKARRPRVPVEPGQRFGDWVVLGVGPYIRTKTGALGLRCRCDGCGTVHTVLKGNVLSGNSLRCRPCSVRKVRKAAPATINRMVLTGIIQRLPLLSDEELDQLTAAVLADRDRRGVI